MTTPTDPLATLIKAARSLIDAITFDDSGVQGRGGNGGLVSRDTIHRADELRLAIAAAEATAKAGSAPVSKTKKPYHETTSVTSAEEQVRLRIYEGDVPMGEAAAELIKALRLTIADQHGHIGKLAGELRLAIEAARVPAAGPTEAEIPAAFAADEMRLALAALRPWQARVEDWRLFCFETPMTSDPAERSHRFLEEALELVQSLGCTAAEAYELVDYVFGRPAGHPPQEVGGVRVTLATVCNAHGIDMDAAGEAELARIWEKAPQIRAKWAAKPQFGPLPGPTIATPDDPPAEDTRP